MTSHLSSASTAATPRRQGWVKVTVAALTVAVVAGSLFAWRSSAAKKEEKKSDADKVFEFAAGDVATLAPQNLGLIIPISGSVRPVLQAMVKSKVAGEVAQMHAREGERVAAGQVLVSIDTADLKARNDSQQAAVAENKARLDLARKNEQNNRTLLSKNFISQNAFDSVANSVEVAEAGHKSAMAQAAITQRALADAQIRAPFTGIVAKRVVNVGEKVSADMPVIQVVDLSRMELEASVPVGDIPSVKVGQEITFTVDGFAGRDFKGKVERINPAAEAGSRSISIFVSLPNLDGALKGGMFANGTLAAVGKSSVNAVPISALVEEGGQTFVYALAGEKIERKPVTPGARSVERGLVEIQGGLETGARVVTVKADGLKHGVKALVKAPGATAPASASNTPATKS